MSGYDAHTLANVAIADFAAAVAIRNTLLSAKPACCMLRQTDLDVSQVTLASWQSINQCGVQHAASSIDTPSPHDQPNTCAGACIMAVADRVGRRLLPSCQALPPCITCLQAEVPATALSYTLAVSNLQSGRCLGYTSSSRSTGWSWCSCFPLICRLHGIVAITCAASRLKRRYRGCGTAYAADSQRPSKRPGSRFRLRCDTAHSQRLLWHTGTVGTPFAQR
jgi:hypothetical protein